MKFFNFFKKRKASKKTNRYISSNIIDEDYYNETCDCDTDYYKDRSKQLLNDTESDSSSRNVVLDNWFLFETINNWNDCNNDSHNDIYDNCQDDTYDNNSYNNDYDNDYDYNNYDDDYYDSYNDDYDDYNY